MLCYLVVWFWIELVYLPGRFGFGYFVFDFVFVLFLLVLFIC